jgi:hypothetical protein
MRQVLRVIDQLDSRAVEATEHLSTDDMAVIVSFLDEMVRVVDGVDVAGRGHRVSRSA